MTKYTFVLALVVGVLCLSASGGQGKRAEHRKAVRGELLARYDVNKDGRIEKSERASMSKLDKKRARKAGLGKKHRHKHAKSK